MTDLFQPTLPFKSLSNSDICRECGMPESQPGLLKRCKDSHRKRGETERTKVATLQKEKFATPPLGELDLFGELI